MHLQVVYSRTLAFAEIGGGPFGLGLTYFRSVGP